MSVPRINSALEPTASEDEFKRLLHFASYFPARDESQHKPIARIFMRVVGTNRSESLPSYVRVVTDTSAQEGLTSRRDLAIDIAGDQNAILLPLLEGQKAAGYALEVDFLEHESESANPNADGKRVFYGESMSVEALCSSLQA